MGSLYSEQRTWFHALRAGFKLFFLVGAGIVLFILQQPWQLALAALLCALLLGSLGRALAPVRRLGIDQGWAQHG